MVHKNKKIAGENNSSVQFEKARFIMDGFKNTNYSLPSSFSIQQTSEKCDKLHSLQKHTCIFFENIYSKF